MRIRMRSSLIASRGGGVDETAVMDHYMHAGGQVSNLVYYLERCFRPAYCACSNIFLLEVPVVFNTLI